MRTFKENVPPINGYLELAARYIETGEPVEGWGDDGRNLVVDIGLDQIMKSFTVQAPAGGPLSFVLDSFSIGDDIGTGTLVSPQPAQPGYTSADQTVVYTLDYADLNVTHPDSFTTEITTVIDGSTVMANYPSEPDVRFSSATLNSGSGEPFAYRRFPTRTITGEIIIDVKWTLTYA